MITVNIVLLCVDRSLMVCACAYVRDPFSSNRTSFVVTAVEHSVGIIQATENYSKYIYGLCS